VEGKLTSFLKKFNTCDGSTEQPCETCTDKAQPQFCQGAIDYAALDAAFRKVTARVASSWRRTSHPRQIQAAARALGTVERA